MTTYSNLRNGVARLKGEGFESNKLHSLLGELRHSTYHHRGTIGQGID